MAALPAPASAQLTVPCEIACTLVLGATGAVAATGATIAWGRVTGGISTGRTAVTVWGTSFALLVGSGVALGGDGERQRRAVYGGAAGAVAGSLAGLVVASCLGGDDGVTAVAAALIGAAAGAWIGGAYGALSHDGSGPADPVPVLSLSVRF